MIKIKEKKNCCGCHACAMVCVKHCITMTSDEEGFLYPIVDNNLCINCGLCEKVCPIINQSKPRQPLRVFAAKNKNEEIRRQSSSGGVFTSLAEIVINEGGIVFGAQFDKDWNVIHSWTDAIEGIANFRGSKYVQSTIGDSYREAMEFLKQGRKVLFTGTPCQIAGLNKYLRKEYDNLLTVEVVCHGVPSPKIWIEYLQMLKLKNIGAISHKDKSTGWREYSFTIKKISNELIFKERATDNIYLKSFLKNYILRPSCFSCPAKAGRSNADISLADYWGIEKLSPEMDDNKGINFVCCNTHDGQRYINSLDLQIKEVNYQDTIPYNACIEKSTNEPNDRQKFWEEYNKKGIKALLSLKKKNIIIRIIKRLFG